jgi:hypothetical protein
MSRVLARTEAEAADVIPLRYVARAGLLPELTRQTYDSLYKALREVVLNSVDAGAKEVILDLSAIDTDGTLTVSDDGAGMTLDELQHSFMSLGGSQKFASKDRFGRIGIGSLALMHYAQRVEIETKRARSKTVTRAVITHPWALDQNQRAQELGDFRAGQAWEEPGAKFLDHFTVVRLHGVDEVLLGECADVAGYYKLVDRLRRILPLSWPGETALAQQLHDLAPQLVALLEQHTSAFEARVKVRSRWSEDDLLRKRMYGDGGSQEERWNGKPRPVLEEVVVEDNLGERTVTVAGYLLSQLRPSVDWIGLTARVQNVAVEERTFFDLESDPGFRKYISGEVWLLGDLDRTHLINIDRTSFNREAPDYRSVARLMQREITRFKAECVQAPQRAKVSIKRRLDQQVGLVVAAERLGRALDAAPADSNGRRGLPSSNNGRMRSSTARGLLEDLQALGAVVAVEQREGARQRPYVLRVADDGHHVLVEVADSLLHPRVELAGGSYGIRLVEARPNDPPLIVRNRPREVVFNLAHKIFAGEVRQSAIEMVMALEFSYLMATTHADEDLYDSVLSLLAGS